MKNKVFQLAKILNKQEIKELRKSLKLKQNIQVFRLHEYCAKHDFTEESYWHAEKVFKVVFKQKYEASQDFLLRNVYRLYTEEMEEIISRTAISERREALVIQELYKRGAGDLASKIERKNKLYTSDLEVLDEAIQYQIKHIKRPIDKKDLAIVVNDLKQVLETNAHDFVFKHYRYRYYLAYLERSMLAVDDHYTPIDLKGYETPQELFKTDEKLELARLRIGLHDPKSSIRKETLNQLIRNLTNKEEDLEQRMLYSYQLGTEHLLEGNNEKAAQFFEPVVHHFRKEKNPLYHVVLFNYLSSKSKLNENELVCSIILDNINELKKAPVYPQFLSLLIASCVLRGDLTTAEAYFPNEINTGSDHFNNYLRLLQTMIHFDNKLFELCEKELSNLKRRFGKLSEVEPSLEAATNTLIELVQLNNLAVSLRAVDFSEEKQKLTASIEAINKEFPFVSLPMKWVGLRIKELKQ